MRTDKEILKKIMRFNENFPKYSDIFNNYAADVFIQAVWVYNE